ncbi:FAD-dependent urate hydroxylase [Colletotrichum spaethianum]|uniref:FAD-dependent urate hydroxylase n=1 Tax=Colletotrichum spaethianum TaxID=700344 RepID=A0AA37P6H9_9PEZI|nr:FAD-dependent urate hydroxylase [Colletotrichum spaethianum]GKT46446.1 FAD-dependent urate hydroxylase [Colletotrichum spaethianum]
MTPPAPRIVGICGAAIAGPTLALHLLTHPVLRTLFRPILFDQTPAPVPVQVTSDGSSSPSSPSTNHHQRAGASVALLPNGLHPLLSLGLGDAIRKHGYECDDLTLWSGPSSLDCDVDAPLTHLKTMVNGFWSHDMQMGAMYFERAGLQSLLVNRVRELGGELRWSKKAVRFEHIAPTSKSMEEEDGHSNSQTRVSFADGTHLDVDLLVGADGGYSPVRRHILNLRDPETAEQRWLPDHMGMTGIYGISSADKMPASHVPERQFSESHSVWLPQGFLATGPCPGRMLRWDLILPEQTPPESRTDPAEDSRAVANDTDFSTVDGEGTEESWHAAIVPSQYPKSATIAILRAHLRLRHPFAGDFKTILKSADRIIHTPLRQRVWKENEIHWSTPSGGGNIVLLGDAARLMLPTSGQGTGFAIEDATVLASMLLKHCGPSSQRNEKASAAGSDFRAAAEGYARLRVPRSGKMATVASWVGSVGLGSAWYYRALRHYAAKMSPGADLK